MNTAQTKKVIILALSVAVVLLVGLGGALTLSRAKQVAPDRTVQVLTNEELAGNPLRPWHRKGTSSFVAGGSVI